MVGKTATVLFVEDDIELRLPVVYSLELAGFQVLAAGTGEEALGILRDEAGRADWLFTDIHLPGPVDGWQVAEEFRLLNPLRPVIFATGAASERPRTGSEGLLLRKPYAVSDVVRAFQLLSRGWDAWGDDAKALRYVKSLPFGGKLTWTPAPERTGP